MCRATNATRLASSLMREATRYALNKHKATMRVLYKVGDTHFCINGRTFLLVTFLLVTFMHVYYAQPYGCTAAQPNGVL